MQWMRYIGAFGRAPAGSGSHTVVHCSAQELEPGEKKTSFSSSDGVSERGEQERKNGFSEQYDE
jgi:hypothetical protein